MPWPFRNRKQASPAAAPPAPSGPPPVTAADLAPPRLAMPVRRAWATLPPITRTVSPPSDALAAPQASFVQSVAGTQSLVQVPVLRQVSAEGPPGRADDVATAGRSLASPAPTGDPTPPPGAGSAQLPHRSARLLAARERSTATRRLDAYEGELVPYDGPGPGYYDGLPDDWTSAPADPDEIPEELPPPIFSALLAERTGKSLAELRPDLADADGNIVMPDAEPAPRAAGPRRRVSPAELRRMGLGAPQHSESAKALDAEVVDERTATLPAEPRLFGPRPPWEVDEDEIVEEVTLDEPVAWEPDIAPAAPAAEPRPILRFRPAPGADVRRLPADEPAVKAVPLGVRDAVTRATGHDPGPAPVNRGPSASSEATRIGAAAFTRQGEIFLPAEHGPLDVPATRALLAHELTHVVQHRVYGDRLPRPESPVGRRLESEARAVQRWVAGVDDAPKLKPIATSGVKPPSGPALGDEMRETADELVRSGLAHWEVDGTLVFGGGTSGGMGEPWMAVAGTLEAALAEKTQLYEHYRNDVDFGNDSTESSAAFLEYEREFTETYGSQLQSTVGGTGTTSTTPGLTRPQGWFRDEWADAEFADAQEAKKKQEKYQEDRKKILADQETAETARLEHEQAARTQREGGTTGTGTGTGTGTAPGTPGTGTGTAPGTPGTPGTGELRHAPLPGARTGGARTPGAIAGTTAALTESQLLKQQTDDQVKQWELEDKLSKLEESQLEPIPDVVYGGPGGAFADPWAAAEMQLVRDEQKKQADSLREKRTLDYQIAQQKRIDAAKAREQQATQRAQTQADQKKTSADKKKAAGDAKADAKTAMSLTSKATAEDQATLGAPSAGVEEEAESAVFDGLGVEEVEELANILYSRLVTRLRRDLIIDRERAGLLTDFR